MFLQLPDRKIAPAKACVFLYFPQRMQIRQIIQLPVRRLDYNICLSFADGPFLQTDEHPFVGFRDTFNFRGYLAHGFQQISPVYSAQELGTELNQMCGIVGLLAVTLRDGEVRFCDVFEAEIGAGNFLRVIKAHYCRPNSLGLASDVWLSDVLTGHLVQIDGVPFLDRSPPSSTAIEVSRRLEGAPAPDPNEISSLHSSSVPSSSQPSVSSIGQYYGHPGAVSPPTESSASWFGKHNNTPFIASNNYTAEPFDYPPFTSEEPIPETDSAFIGGPPSTIFTSDSYAEESIDYQMEYPMWALNEESLSFPESDGVLVDQHPITVPIIPVNPMVVFHEALVWKNTDPALNKDLRNAIERSLKTSPWKRAFFLTKCIFAGSHWVGIANPFEASEVDQREMLTNSLLAAIEVEGTTLEYLLSKPLPVETVAGNQNVEWKTLRVMLIKYLKCRTDEMRKIVRACIVNETGFSAPSKDARNEKVRYFLALLCASNIDQVIQGIDEITQLHLFRELLWIALLRPVNDLDNETRDGRIGDLFPEEVREQGNLAEGVVGTLMTMIYHTFMILCSEKNTQGRKLPHAYRIIRSALAKMYGNLNLYPAFKKAVRELPFITIENVFPMDPKELCPKRDPNTSQEKLWQDVRRVIVTRNDQSPGLPNSVFTSLRSARSQQQADRKCFYES
ncbi:hypothetical protein C8R48DRAFT_778212 [Suillus tomentosus]|nr:hypothetical protein C8R48DRAFT_778212 [Suillus tomentosus]